MERTSKVKDLRPQIQTSDSCVTDVESFQNVVLRPIIKFQHPLMMLQLAQEKNLTRIATQETDDAQRVIQVKQYLSRNLVLRSTLVGMVTGLLSEDEFPQYLLNKRELDRRIISMLAQRFSDQRQAIIQDQHIHH